MSSLSALLATVWIILPAPSRFFWLFSVLASEWSLAFAALAVFGIVCSIASRARGSGRLWLASLLAGCLALLLSLYPFGSAWRVAREHHVSLSLRQYVFGLRGEKNDNSSEANAPDFKTYTFANVEGRALQLDAYLPPRGVESNGAGVIVVHGGAWSAGVRSDFPQWNRWLARQGFAVFDIDYRLAPQPNWQTATGDVKCAVAWVKAHAAEFQISPDRIALLGRSAGAHLALLVAYSSDDARLPSSCAETKTVEESVLSRTPGEEVRAVVSFYAPTDLPWSFDNPANQRVIDGPAALSDFVGGNPHTTNEIGERFALMSPTTHVTARTPPTLLIHGGHDQLVRVENMFLLDRKLTEAGVRHETIFIPYAQHGFDYNFNGWGAQIVQPLLLDFLRENTKPR